jgi:hypothetical protein
MEKKIMEGTRYASNKRIPTHCYDIKDTLLVLNMFMMTQREG